MATPRLMEPVYFVEIQTPAGACMGPRAWPLGSGDSSNGGWWEAVPLAPPLLAPPL